MTRHTRTLFLLALLLGAIGWASNATTASAGGPTSVLLTNPGAERANALYVGNQNYDRLLDAVGTEARGDSKRPPGVASDDDDAVRLTWLVHDTRVWRIDTVHLTSDDGIWVGTYVDLTGDGDLYDQPARWYRPKDDKALTKLLTRLGLLGTDAEPSTAPSKAPPPSLAPGPAESAATAAAASSTPGQPLPVVLAAGLGGLIIGTVGTLLLRRPRNGTVPRVTPSG
jgi:hypothetical protein